MLQQACVLNTMQLACSDGTGATRQAGAATLCCLCNSLSVCFACAMEGLHCPEKVLFVDLLGQL